MFSVDTIVAPATPPGEGGVGIIRLSGPNSEALLQRTFRGKKHPADMMSHHLYHGHLVDKDNDPRDEVLVTIMRSPASYTGEDVVEIHCHGGTQVMRSLLDLFLENGARMAAPGEFTQRAFVNGKLDLAQAEAVVGLIGARSARAGRVALSQLDGHLSQKVYRFSESVKTALALLEAHIDFPDDEVGALDLPALMDPVHEVAAEMQALADTFDFGRVLREGISILILGRPNVGKSSLMNAILGEARAIVTEVPGTTRDTLEEQLVLAGFPVRLIDAAGVRDTDDPVEQEGVRRAKDKAAAADLVLLVLDGSNPLNNEDLLAIDLCAPENTIVVFNKADLAQHRGFAGLETFIDKVSVSAKHGLGLSQLRDAIVRRMTEDEALDEAEGVVVNERRHKDALLQGLAAYGRLVDPVAQGAPPECLAMELREMLSALGQITGETTPDEILDQVFSRFCIGK